MTGDTARLIRRHVLTAVAVTIGLLCALTAVEWRLAGAEADRITREAATRVAERVTAVLGAADLADAPDADALDARLEGFFAAGVVTRVKVWRIDGDVARVVYSDERRLVGDERASSPELAAALARGGVVVREVPEDVEHRFESAESSELREAFVASTDATGAPLRVEVYVPVFRDAWVASTLTVYLPVLLGGIALLVAVLAPLSVRLTRRVVDTERDRRRALDDARHARESERLRLARRLHDDVLQDLGGAALALEALSRRDHPDSQRLRAIAGTVAEDARTLRGLLADDLVADPPPLAQALAQAIGPGDADDPAPTLDVDPRVTADPAMTRLLTEAAGELARNARRHARASRIAVRVTDADGDAVLVVEDDGRGFDPRRTPDARFGLRLLADAVDEAGGTLRVESSAAGTRIEMRVPVGTRVSPRTPAVQRSAGEPAPR